MANNDVVAPAGSEDLDSLLRSIQSERKDAQGTKLFLDRLIASVCNVKPAAETQIHVHWEQAAREMEEEFDR